MADNERTNELRAKALRDMRAWLRKLLFNLSRDFEVAAHEVGRR